LTMHGFYQKAKEKDESPLNFAPVWSSFRLDKDGQTVRSSDRSVVLYSNRIGKWTGSGMEPHLQIKIPLQAGKGSVELSVIRVEQKQDPSSKKWVPKSFQDSLKDFRGYWAKVIEKSSTFSVPEERLQHAVKRAMAQILIISDKGLPMYGAYWYETCIGWEEWWSVLGLAQWGFENTSKNAALRLHQSYRGPEANHHFPYQNASALSGVAEIAWLYGDLDWYRKSLKTTDKRVNWIVNSIENDNKDTPYEQLIRKFAYGGDVRTPAVSLFYNAISWRGLFDTALLFNRIGKESQGRAFLKRAELYRNHILKLWEPKIQRQVQPPFVPLALDLGTKGKPDFFTKEYQEVELPYQSLHQDKLGNYWNLFMQSMLELGFYPKERPERNWLMSYMQQRGGLIGGLARYHDAIDWHYGIGYIKSLLKTDQRETFLLSFYAALVHGFAQDVGTPPEELNVWPTRISNLASVKEYQIARWVWQTGWDEPLGPPSGVFLQLVRMMLVREELTDSGQEGSLHLLSGIPRTWLEDGKQIHIRKAPTRFGELSLQVQSFVKKGFIEIKGQLSSRGNIKELVFKLPHPDKKAIRSVRLNERSISSKDGETISFKPSSSTFVLRVSY